MCLCLSVSSSVPLHEYRPVRMSTLSSLIIRSFTVHRIQHEGGEMEIPWTFGECLKQWLQQGTVSEDRGGPRQKGYYNNKFLFHSMMTHD